MTFRLWREAMHEALYGHAGFYAKNLPGAHFRTSVTTSPLFAAAIRQLADRVDHALGRPDPFDVVDLGAGGGELLAAWRDVPARWRLVPVDVNGRWTRELPAVTGLLVANEWLDNVPLDVVARGRLVEVDDSGAERLGAPAGPDLRAWTARWWPAPGRVEVGLSRDAAWRQAVGRLTRGLAVAIDYGHSKHERRSTLAGYRDGVQVRAVPDGSCDLTAHVALDSCAAATGARLISQRQALQALGLRVARPQPDAFGSDGRGYLSCLATAGSARELLDPSGLGGFRWLVQPVGGLTDLPL